MWAIAGRHRKINSSFVNISSYAIVAPMSARQSPSSVRAFALAVALFAVTLAVLQPLSHAVMLRMGGPEAVAGLWEAICQTDVEGRADEPDRSRTKMHECCFGLAHSPVLIGPTVAPILVADVSGFAPIAEQHHHSTNGAIRDGPQQPRAPPLFD